MGLYLSAVLRYCISSFVSCLTKYSQFEAMKAVAVLYGCLQFSANTSCGHELHRHRSICQFKNFNSIFNPRERFQNISNTSENLSSNSKNFRRFSENCFSYRLKFLFRHVLSTIQNLPKIFVKLRTIAKICFKMIEHT